MALLPLVLAIPRFKGNENRIDQFTNGTALQTWTTSEGIVLPTLAKFLADKDAEINAAADSILAAAIAARDAAQASAADALDSANDAEAAYNNTVILVTNLTIEQPSRAYAIANYHPTAAPTFIRVAGYANPFDGGQAGYRNVGSEPTHPGKFSITLQGGAVAWYELQGTLLVPQVLGAVADFNPNTLVGTDNLTPLRNWLLCLHALKAHGHIPAGIYGFSDTISSDSQYLNITGEGESSILFYTGTSTIAFGVGNGITVTATTDLSNNVRIGQNGVAVTSAAGMAVGDLVTMRSTAAWYNDPRGDTAITSDAIGLLPAGSTTTVIQLPPTFAVASSIVGKHITFTSGALKNYSRQVISYDNTLKQITVAALPSAPVLNDRYVFPVCVKGFTSRITRIITSTQIELRDSIPDAYLVLNGDPTLVRESVTVRTYKGISPVLRDFVVQYAGSATTQLLSISNAYDVDCNVRTRGGKSSGVTIFRSVGGKVEAISDSINGVQLGYGAQVFECTDVIFSGRGWNNRRLIDISGNAPSVRCVVRGIQVSGGGLQADGQAYYPIGSVENFGTGSHGAGHNTIYEECEFNDVTYGIYERGRGAIIRDCVFGPSVKFPIFHAFGGRLEVYDNVCDARIFSRLNPTEATELVSGSIVNAKGHYAESFVTLGGSLINEEANTEIFVKDNFVRVQKFVVAFDIQGGSARILTGLNVYDNDCEFYPPNVSDENGLYGKTTTAGAGVVVIESGQHGSELFTAAGWKAPLVFNTGVQISTAVQVATRFNNHNYNMRLASASAAGIRIGQSVKDKIRVDVSIEEDDTKWFSGWVKKNSTTLITYSGVGVEALATAPDGVIGGTTVFQLHYADGVLTLGNKLGFNRTFNLIIYPTV